MSMDRFVIKECDQVALPTNVAEKLHEAMTNGTMEEELTLAIAYLTKLVADDPEMLKPLGLGIQVLSPKQIHNSLKDQMAKGNPSPNVYFAGTLGMLDLNQRNGVFADMDCPKLRFACERLLHCASVATVLAQVNIQADVISDTLTGLVNIDNASEIQSVILAMYWNRDDPTVCVKMQGQSRNLALRAQYVGLGIAVDVERFRRNEDDEKKRHVLGKSAWAKCRILANLVASARHTNAPGITPDMKDHFVAATMLKQCPELVEDWKPDTCDRYLRVATSTSEPEIVKLIRTWEYHCGRESVIDHVSTLRACCVAASTPDELYTLLSAMFWEQRCKIRTHLKTRNRGTADAVMVLKALLLRMTFIHYAQQSFPKLEDSIKCFGKNEFYQQRFGLTSGGGLNKAHTISESEEEPPVGDETVTRFESKRKLVYLLTECQLNTHESTFCAAVRDAGKAGRQVLDLRCEALKSLFSKLQSIHEVYLADFPPAPQVVYPSLVDVPASDDTTVSPVKVTTTIVSAEEYHTQLAEWCAKCRQEEGKQIKIFLGRYIKDVILTGITSDVLTRKLSKIEMLQEPGRKLWLHDLLVSRPVPWAKMRHEHRAIRPITNVEVVFDPGHLDTDAGDTFRPLKSAYTMFRCTNGPDGKCEDVIGIVCPGEDRDKPTNDVLVSCYKSLKHLIPTHLDPKIGTIELQTTTEVNRIFSRKQDHQFVFTSQHPPGKDSRKKMRYLSGHSSVNTWPVPDKQFSQRMQTTLTQHDKIFDGQGGHDGDPSDESTFPMHSLGDKVVPFPFELDRVFVQEVIDLMGIKVGIFLEVGSGECLVAALIENIRCVAVFKSTDHKNLIFDRLASLVKNLRLVKLTLPPKPAALEAWEQTKPAEVPKAAAVAPAAPAVAPAAPAVAPTITPAPAYGQPASSTSGPTPTIATSPAPKAFRAFGAI